jgi:hypothetical protein
VEKFRILQLLSDKYQLIMDTITIIVLWIVFSLIVGFIGSNRTIGFGSAFIVSLILSPLIGLIVVIFSGKKPNLTDAKIAHEAGVITDAEYKEKVRKVVPTTEDKQDTKRGYIITGVIIIVVIIIWQIVKLFK